MTWFRVDDTFHAHPKRLALTAHPRALALWTVAGSWCAQQLTDGVVSPGALSLLNGRESDAKMLAKCGLWEPFSDGWIFHDWSDWNPTRAQVLARRQAEAARLAAYRARRKAAAQQDAGAGVTPVHAAYHSGQSPVDAPVDTPVDTGQATPGVTAYATSGVTAGVRGSLPDPTLSTKNKNYGTPSEFRADDHAQAIVGDWIDSADKRPPKRVVGQVARTVGELLSEGLDPGDVRAGLAAWTTRGLHPSVLPSVVHEIQTAPRRTNGSRRPSTTDQRVADNLAVVERFAREEGLTP